MERKLYFVGANKARTAYWSWRMALCCHLGLAQPASQPSFVQLLDKQAVDHIQKRHTSMDVERQRNAIAIAQHSKSHIRSISDVSLLFINKGALKVLNSLQRSVYVLLNEFLAFICTGEIAQFKNNEPLPYQCWSIFTPKCCQLQTNRCINYETKA